MAVQRWGSQTIVNTTTAGRQFVPSVAALADGGYVIAWQDGAGDPSSIRAQRFDATGRKVGSEFQVDTLPGTGHDGGPSAIALSNGGFQIGWSNQFSGADVDVSVSTYDAAGTKIIERRPVESINDEQRAALAANGAGAAIAYENRSVNGGDVFLQRIDATGSAIGGPIPVNTDVTAGAQVSPDIAQLTGGNLAVVWQNAAAGNEVRLRIFNASGGAVTPNEVLVSTGTELNPSIAALANGNLVVTWESFVGAGNYEARARIFDSSGNALSGIIPLNSFATGSQTSTEVVGLPTGGFIAFWTTEALDPFERSLRGQLFDAFGGRQGSEFFVADASFDFTDIYGGSRISAATLADGRVVVTWAPFGGDGNADGIVSQIFDPRDGVVNGNGGANVLYGSDLHGDDIAGFAGNDSLIGLKGDDSLYGGVGDDRLRGGLGADEHDGGSGLDVVDYTDCTSAVNVNLTAGIATGTYAVGDTFTSIEGAIGSNFADVLTGNALANPLNGAVGADLMRGLAGNDIYVIDNAGDVADEGVAGSSGIDLIQSAITFSLSDAVHVKGSIESLTLIGAATINATGNAGGNVLTGNIAANALDGAAGADVMRGMGGNDTYIVDNLGDVVDELVAGSSGIDFVRSTVTINLSDAVHFKGFIDHVTLLGAVAIQAVGNGLNNTMIGNGAANTLVGRAGSDNLTGGLGNDHFRFDVALGPTNIDTVTDFDVDGAGADSFDTIQLENGIFTQLTTLGDLAASRFLTVASNAQADNGRTITYVSSTGGLFYDTNGAADGGATLFAVLDTGLALTAADFFVT